MMIDNNFIYLYCPQKAALFILKNNFKVLGLTSIVLMYIIINIERSIC